MSPLMPLLQLINFCRDLAVVQELLGLATHGLRLRLAAVVDIPVGLRGIPHFYVFMTKGGLFRR